MTTDTASNSQIASKQIGHQKNLEYSQGGGPALNFNNNMDNITSFLYKGKIRYVANNKDNTGILVYDESYNLIASSMTSQMKLHSDNATFIEDVAVGTQGRYIYMTVTYITGATRYSAFWELDILNNDTKFMFWVATDQADYGPNSNGGIHSCNSIAVIPSPSGDLVIGFPSWTSGYASPSTWINYTVMNHVGMASPLGGGVYTHEIKASDLFSLHDYDDRKIMMEDFYISRTSTSGVYEMVDYGRSRDDGWKNNTVFNKVLIRF